MVSLSSEIKLTLPTRELINHQTFISLGGFSFTENMILHFQFFIFPPLQCFLFSNWSGEEKWWWCSSIFCVVSAFDHNSIHYRARHGEGSSVSRPGYSSYSSYPGAESSLASLAIHQSSVSGEQERIIMTQVTPDQSIRGIDSPWSSVNTPGM